MEQQKKRQRPSSGIWTGVFFVTVGILLLANKMDAGIPGWIFTWPTLLIGIGLLIGLQHRFRNPLWILLIGIGSLFLIDRQMPGLNLRDFIPAIATIMLGLFFIFRRRHRNYFKEEWKDKWKEEWKDKWKEEWKDKQKSAEPGYDINSTHEGEFIESNIFLGGVKKRVLSKNFKGGEINSFMGGSEIDLTQADIQGTVIIEVNQIFGGTKLILPPHWVIKTSEANVVLGGIEDKRPVKPANIDTNKVLVIKGTTVFGGIELNSY